MMARFGSQHQLKCCQKETPSEKTFWIAHEALYAYTDTRVSYACNNKIIATLYFRF